MSKFSQLCLPFPVSRACSGESMETLKNSGTVQVVAFKCVIFPQNTWIIDHHES